MAQISRLEKKLDVCIDNKEYYEAHQICRTLFYRLTSSGKFDELLALLEKGCLTLISVGEFGSAYDLSEAFADSLLKSGVPVTEQRLASIAKIVKGLPSQIDQNIEGDKDRRVKFIAACVKWSQAVATRPSQKARGAPALHALFARVLYSEGAVEMARSHFLLSDAPEEFGEFLHDWYVRGEMNGERTNDLWITVAVLQLLCLRRVSFARRLLAAFIRAAHPTIQPPYSSRPLVHFCWLLARIVPTRNIHTYTALISKYRNELGSSEEQLMTYLDQIGQLYIGVAPKAPPMGGGMLGSLLKGLMGGGGQQQEKEKIASSDDEGGQIESDADAALVQAELNLLIRGGGTPAMTQVDDDLD